MPGSNGARKLRDPRALIVRPDDPLWPSWEPTGAVRIGLSGQRYFVMRALRPRPANRTKQGAE